MDKAIDFSRLAQARPPADLWPAIAGELDRRRKQRFARRMFGAAAVFLLAALAVLVTQVPQVATDDQPPAAQSLRLDDLQARSAQLEEALAFYRSGVVESDSLESLVWLEVELAWLDSQLAGAPEDSHLWRERVELLEELGRRYASEHWGNDILVAGI